GVVVTMRSAPVIAPLASDVSVMGNPSFPAMGSDAEHKNEIRPAAIAAADLYVADSLKQTRRLGELHHAIDAGLVAGDAVFAELGKIV
ncbi:ornithine cyclodeaminase family protein, partial [Rhizobium ruizarguesonis]